MTSHTTTPVYADTLNLDSEEQRVVGCLMEKQTTVPASYPLTLNSLKTACNQLNSREPVTEYDDKTVLAAANRLKERGLIRVVWSDRGQRTLKYHQIMDEVLVLPNAERALITVLLLRGPQAPGALKTRTDRLHKFKDREEVEALLRQMAALEHPLVVELERRHGEKDNRWIHLLGPVDTELGHASPAAAGREAAPTVDRDQVIAESTGGAAGRDARVLAAYDACAEAYADACLDELDNKPFDRWLLERIAAEAYDPMLDVGAGPGHIAAFLSECGADVTGLDNSAAMVTLAGERFPDLTFQQGDLRTLMRPPTASGWGAVVSWYSLVHFAASELTDVVGSMARVLRDDGVLAIALHLGHRVLHAEELFGSPADVHFVEHDANDVIKAVEAAGLTDVEWYQRGPLPGTNESSTRLYVLARRPAAG